MAQNDSAETQPAADVLVKRRQEAIGVYIEASKAISDNVRLVGIGYLALYFAFLSTEELNLIGSKYPIIMFLIGSSGILTIILDYLQQIFRYFNAYDVQSSTKKIFNKQDFKYRATKFFFIAKQLVAAVGGICVIYVFAAVSGTFSFMHI